jgi:hypothetical protein
LIGDAWRVACARQAGHNSPHDRMLQ